MEDLELKRGEVIVLEDGRALAGTDGGAWVLLPDMELLSPVDALARFDLQAEQVRVIPANDWPALFNLGIGCTLQQESPSRAAQIERLTVVCLGGVAPLLMAGNNNQLAMVAQPHGGGVPVYLIAGVSPASMARELVEQMDLDREGAGSGQGQHWVH